MVTRQTVLINETGLHARPAAEFVALAKTFSSRITIQRLDQASEAVNAKSILSILTQGLAKDTPIEICAEGPDEEMAANDLVRLIETAFEKQ